ncbi:beta-galactosidase 8 [Selaginella moellendorffii]|uniref:beta-galactosidase 8 n=1 Tax=Selaginella moellendorffii TaxID=88036 RepID=UPI000D1C269F|nr:beta-galactosidase 8 [Selaginella moellendorffii]|eukprot:XP_024532429.1 beta-galactosidase 8 [Selaginella moellendorffii]
MRFSSAGKMALTRMLLVSMALAALQTLGASQGVQSRSFSIENDAFYKDGEPFRILGGEIHYFRIVPEYWKDRIQRAKAMGLNTIQTYVPWNVHEPSEGEFFFGDPVNLEAFLKLAQELEVLVMLRMGPYVCGEWDLGGFPSWLLSKQPQLKLRTSDSSYLKLVDQWWNVLLPKLVPFLYSRGGPVIMLQVENEYGSFGSDKQYLHHLVSEAREYLGNEIILYTTDGATEDALQRGTISRDDVYAAVDFPTGWDPVAAFALQKNYNSPGKSPALSTEFYTGWLTHWGENLATTSPYVAAAELDKLLSANGSVVLYMAHGGSNFGFFSGANTGGKETIYQPDITSYDYDAPIGEGGDLGEKFWRFREVLSSYVNFPLPDPPQLPSRRNTGTVVLQKLANLFQVLQSLSHEFYLQQAPVTMELLNQSFGFIVYRSRLPSHAKPGSILEIKKIHDRAQVYVGKSSQSLRLVGTLQRWSNSSLQLPDGSSAGMEIYILVENMGRINYGPFIFDQKGILSSVILDNVPMLGWRAYTLSLADVAEKFQAMPNDLAGFQRHGSIRIESRAPHCDGPAFYAATFESEAQMDTFISFKGWSKGVAFVNGFNLGRFWPDAGPQCSLYVPGPLLRQGENQLLILELENTLLHNKTLQFLGQHDWTCGKNS